MTARSDATSERPLLPWQKFVAELRTRPDDLSQRAAREIESLREQIKELQIEIRETANASHQEGYWQAVQGEDYGSY